MDLFLSPHIIPGARARPPARPPTNLRPAYYSPTILALWPNSRVSGIRGMYIIM